MSNFRVGQKVVCVDDEVRPPYFFSVSVKRGRVYTISGFGGKDTIFVAEAKAVNEDYGFGWFRDRFRPVVKRKTDISVFKAMLNPSKVKEAAE